MSYIIETLGRLVEQTASSRSDCFWDASCKYLSGHYVVF